ncbi:sporulation protein YlmC/YmxH family [Mycoplasma sp. CAG:877]|jgi:sporulation protein, ylmC/ymxH family|nr:sporulation protein YlmC/YmxH family [Mycoplasma sp. CAG:877]
MRLSDLQTKSIVSVNDGKNIGNIIDANVTTDGTIESLVIEANKTFFSLNRENDTEINWKDITKIGEDVILVKISYHE